MGMSGRIYQADKYSMQTSTGVRYPEEFTGVWYPAESDGGVNAIETSTGHRNNTYASTAKSDMY